MQTQELDKIIKTALPGVDACDSKLALDERARKEMTYYLRLMLFRVNTDESHSTAMAKRHARVVGLFANIEKCLTTSDDVGRRRMMSDDVG